MGRKGKPKLPPAHYYCETLLFWDGHFPKYTVSFAVALWPP